MIITQSDDDKDSIETILAGVTPEKVGGEFDLGEDVGKERIEI